MITAGEIAIDLDLPEAPSWRKNSQPYTLTKVDLGEIKLTACKSADGLIHIHAEEEGAGKAVRTGEGVLVEPKPGPLSLVIRWSKEGVDLLLDGHQSKRLLWRTPPLPDRP